MRTRTELNLKSDVRLVETYCEVVSTRSYRLLAEGNRELLQEYARASTAPSPSLCSLVRFDERGRVVEDVDVDRPLIDQEAYRRLYRYDDVGHLAEIADYDENDRLVEIWRYSFSANGKKASEEIWLATGHLRSRSEFDAYENLVRLTWFRQDGSTEREQTWEYQYLRKGNITEQLISFPEEEQANSSSLYALLAVGQDVSSSREVQRSTFIHDDGGNLREQLQYWPDGSIRERKLFDERGVLREEHQSSGTTNSTIKTFDPDGRILQMRVVAPAGYLSQRETNDVTTFVYDLQGNLTAMDTTFLDGTLVRSTRDSYRYDQKGNWIERTETDLNQTWQTNPFPASFESTTRFTRKIEYFEG